MRLFGSDVRSVYPTCSREMPLLIVRSDYDQLALYGSAHPIHGSRSTGPDGIPKVPLQFGHNGDWAARASNDCSLSLKGRSGTEVDDKPCILGRALPPHSGPGFNTEESPSLGSGDIGNRGSRMTSATFHVHNAGGSCRPAYIGWCARLLPASDLVPLAGLLSFRG